MTWKEFKKSKVLALLEIVVIFIGLPLIYNFELIPVHKSIPLLFMFFIYLAYLLKVSKFKLRRLGLNGFKQWSDWKPVLTRFAFVLIILLIIMYIFDKEHLYFLPRTNIIIWLGVAFLYPIWSVIPQELIYRAYFFKRFAFFFKNEIWLILVNAFLFSFAHIIFNNWIAVTLTFLGSIMFARTYIKSKSLLVVFIEHTLYGVMIFTIGLGRYFYLPMN
ncbi:MAG: CPBP family intramembrane glutamic endopeptidase [Bacteroidota bacterium]